MRGEQIVMWSNHARELKGTQKEKVHKYMELGLVEYDKGEKAFLIHPIPNNTKTTHRVKNHKAFNWQCDCQGWCMKLKKHEKDPLTEPAPSCSHTGVVWEFLKRQHNTRRAINIQMALEMWF